MTVRVLGALMLAAVATRASAQIPGLTPRWTLSIEASNGITTQTWSPSSRCFGVLTTTAAEVRDANNHRLLWSWSYHAFNRLIEAGSIAVSPTCDVIAIGGTTNYKYVWIAPRRGKRTTVRTVGTPAQVKFTTDGTAIVITTGVGRAYLASLTGQVTWTGDDKDLRSNAPNAPAVFHRADALSFTTWPWIQLGGANLSDDDRLLLSWDEANHGCDPGDVSSWQAPDQERIWSKSVACPSAAISHAGNWIFVSGELKNDTDSGEDACECADARIYVIAPDGNVVRSWPVSQAGEIVAVAPSDSWFLFRHGDQIDAYDSTANPRGSISVLRDAALSLSPDGRSLLIREGQQLRLLRFDDHN